MKKPTNIEIEKMSITLEGAVKAAIWKWMWICQANKKDVIREWPECGLCIYRDDKGLDCNKCPLVSCGKDSSEYQIVLRADRLLACNIITLAGFRVVAKKMLNKIKAIKI